MNPLNQRLIREIGFMKDNWVFLLNVPVNAPVPVAVEAMQAFNKEIQDMIDMAIKTHQEAQQLAQDQQVTQVEPGGATSGATGSPIDVEALPQA